MMTFKQYLREGKVDLETLETQLDDFLKLGEIVNPEYQLLKDNINWYIRREVAELEKEHTHGRGSEIDATGDEALRGLVYSLPDSTTGILALKSKLARVKSVQSPFYKAVKAYYDKRVTLAEKLKTLKDKVITSVVKRTNVKIEKDAVMKQKFTDSKSLIDVLTKHLEEYTARAAKMATAQVDQAMLTLKEADWSLDKAAPLPDQSARNEVHMQVNEKRAFLINLTDGKGDKRTESESRREIYVKRAEENAHTAYMAWVAKMIDKIGKTVEKATMDGSPWTGSTLSVTTHDGEEQVWDNKMIINQSKYQVLFNQFPSRRIK